MIFTDAKGRPIPKPSRKDFQDIGEFFEAWAEYQRALCCEASAAVYRKRGK